MILEALDLDFHIMVSDMHAVVEALRPDLSGDPPAWPRVLRVVASLIIISFKPFCQSSPSWQTASAAFCPPALRY
jgi:hypothetical protein